MRILLPQILWQIFYARYLAKQLQQDSRYPDCNTVTPDQTAFDES